MEWIKCILIVNLLIIVPINGEKLYGLLQDVVDQDFTKLNISEQCEHDLLVIRKGLDERDIWAIKLLDTSSFIRPDFMWGNNYLNGAPRSCYLINDPVKPKFGRKTKIPNSRNFTQVRNSIQVDYRTVHIRHHSPLQVRMQFVDKDILDFGFCMPISCDDNDSERIFNLLIHNETFLGKTLFGNELELIETKIPAVTSKFLESPFVQAFLYITAIVLCLSLLDIVYKLFRKISHKELKESKPSIWERILNCFSLNENIKIILPTKPSGPDAILILNGLRAFGMAFIVGAHVGVFASVNNVQHLLLYFEEVWFQPFYVIYFSIDTFFVISATLSSYVFFQILKSGKSKNDFVLFIKLLIGRYMRLTPSYIIQMLMIMTVDRLVKQKSFFYLINDNEVKCERDWWKAFLYINNFTSLGEMCMMWSYFLAADFHLFLISIILLFIVTYNKKLGISLFIIVHVVCLAICCYLVYSLSFDLALPTYWDKAHYLYTPFWSRTGPYFIGIFVGWYLNYSERKLNLKKIWIICLWILAFIALFGMSFSHSKVEISPIKVILCLQLVPLIWSLSIAWIIVACACGKGGVLNDFLTSTFFIPFARLSYSAFLVNISAIRIFSMLNDTPLQIDFGISTIVFFGFVASIFLISIVFLVLFEAPSVKLLKLFLK